MSLLQTIPHCHADFEVVRSIQQAQNKGSNIVLVQQGILGCTPTLPTMAISLHCLELYHQLWQHQSSFSIQAFTKVHCVLHNIFGVPVLEFTVFCHKQTFHDQFSGTFDACLMILQEVHSCMDAVLGRSKADLHLHHGCPPCTFKQPNEPFLKPAQLMAMDGNNSAKHMDGAGHADHWIFPSKYMISPANVVMFKDMSMINRVNELVVRLRSENIVQIFKQTGIFLSACHHGTRQTVTEMQHSGELCSIFTSTETSD
ncbi:hypothetical protein PAXRUDRAFT_171477 [Paxillus rubicundulus Ve08.2h10]|uniref:Uncharacterized protein n=1 Tax=Paxillus rubicundulus Ve08.2h10 TaxID=930991 RepID=A0A0D0BX73_9AGAM|nr:hypothetical protein PAXRUDRAFT_171477 [Paxillus rubicundulus Ve08.2h10]